MKIYLGMFNVGLFLLAISVGTVESNSNRFSLPLGIAVGLTGAALLFFSFEENRSLIRLKRKAQYLVWKYSPWG